MSDYFVHESSYVEDDVKIGKDTKIWHFCHIQSGASIGEKCLLGQNVNIAGNVKIGNYVKIQNNVSVYEGVELEDYVFCGPSMVFTNDATPRSKYPKGREQQNAPIKCTSYARPRNANFIQICIGTYRRNNRRSKFIRI